jgi:O-antigen/teichoic acid export membrane protein
LTGIRAKLSRHWQREGDSLLGNSSTYLVANILYAIPPFLLLPVLTRYLTASEYGVLGMFQMLLAALAAFTGLNVQGAANRKYFDQADGIDLPAYIGACLQIVIAATTIVLVAAWLAADQLAELVGVSRTWILVAVAVSGASCLNQLRLGQWQVRNNSLAYGGFQVSLSLLNVGLSLWLIIALSQGLEGRLWGQALPTVVFGCAALVLTYRAGLLKLNWRPDYLVNALRFGVPLIPHTLGVFALSMIDRVVIKQILGLEQTGIYIVAAQLAMALVIIADAINKAWVPYLFERLKADNPDDIRGIIIGTYTYFAAATGIAALVWVLAPSFLPWFAGEQYAAAAPVLGWLALGQAFEEVADGQFIGRYEPTGDVRVQQFSPVVLGCCVVVESG